MTMSRTRSITAARRAHAGRWLLLSGIVGACGGTSGGSADGAVAARDAGAAGARGVAVSTAIVALAPLDVTLRETGTVIARPGSFATVSAPAPARVTRIYVETGQRVTRGMPLLAVEAAPFAAALREAQAAQQAARLAAERATRLAGEGIVPRREVEQTRATLAQTEAALVLASRNAELATLRAPISGVVARLGAVLNATADPSQPLAEVVDPTALEVRVLVAPADAARLWMGAPVAFAGPDGEALGTGSVRTVAPAVDSLSGAVETRARVTSPSRALRLGESVTASIRLGSSAPVLAVPVSALVPDADGYRVFVVTQGDTARARPVTVGRRTERDVEVTGGLHPGETVVTEGAYGLDDGVRITRVGAVPPRVAPKGSRP